MDAQLAANFFLAMMAIANPLGKAPLWVEATHGTGRPVQSRLAVLIVATAAAVLYGALFAGRLLLDLFSIDLASFRVGGGVVILLLGVRMLDGHVAEFHEHEDDEEASDLARAKARFREVVVPLAIPIIAGPGSISTVVIFAARAEGMADSLVLAATLAVALALILGVFLAARWIERVVGRLTLDVLTRLFGLILTAIAAQLILEGLADVFPHWVTPASDLVRPEGSESVGGGPG